LSISVRKFQEHWDDQKYLQGLREDVNEMIKELNITTNRNVDLMEAKGTGGERKPWAQPSGAPRPLEQRSNGTRKSEEVYLQLGRRKLLAGVGHRHKGIFFKAPTQGNLFQSKKENRADRNLPTLLNFALSPALARLITKTPSPLRKLIKKMIRDLLSRPGKTGGMQKPRVPA
jgi:hypothetical protein